MVRKKASKPNKTLQVVKTSRVGRYASKAVVSIRRPVDNLLARRPHRSFRLTRRRDYLRSLALPGYFKFSFEVLSVLRKRKAMWLYVAAIFVVIGLLLGSITSQQTYRTLGTALEDSAGVLVEGDVSQFTQAGLLAISAFSSATTNIGEAQQVYLGLVAILVWLITVWLLREQLAGRRPNLRDGLYSSGSPLVSTFLVSIVLILQLLPIGILALVYTALASTGLINEGFGAFLAFVTAALTIALTLYWLTATFISLVVVTLPGMYPMQALRTGGDLVVGRRLRIMYRLLWLAFWTAFTWLAVMIPVIMLDKWLVTVWDFWVYIPVVSLVASAVSSLLMIYIASYIYLLYRKVVDDDASPA